jgi:NADPH-dependent 7-cyano-7-deazaguanine reductase QueF
MKKNFSLSLLMCCTSLNSMQEPQSPESSSSISPLSSSSHESNVSCTSCHLEEQKDYAADSEDNCLCITRTMSKLTTYDPFIHMLEELNQKKRYQNLEELDCPDAQEYIRESLMQEEEAKTPRTHLKDFFTMHTGYIPEDCAITKEMLGFIIQDINSGNISQEELIAQFDCARIAKKEHIAARKTAAEQSCTNQACEV